MDPKSSPPNSNTTVPVVATLPAYGSDSSTGKPISLWPGMFHSPVTHMFERLLDPPVDAPPQSELLNKTPSQSRTTILYTFSSDYIPREQYKDPWNEVRIGKLLEDLDALAGTISVKHRYAVDTTTRPLLLVTASVDKIVLKKPISVDIDLKIVGAVIWVGRSSLEIQLEVTQSTKDRDSILLRDTSLENSLICQPQQRNMHGRIFGGFLMHRAFELALSTAYAFAGLVPCFLEVDSAYDFLRPVDVGDFLRFKSCVLYTEVNPDQPLITIEVIALVTRPELRSSEVSNTFYFTFTGRPEAKATKNGFRIRNVVPATEEEARRILERKDAQALLSSTLVTK